MIDKCVEEICNLPLKFNSGNKSAYTLAKESGFDNYYSVIKTESIREYLRDNDSLLDAWQLWSLNKRTSGGYFLSFDKTYTYGAIDENGDTIFKESYNNKIDACSEFIYHEVLSILGLEKN
jgi:hypothetical protein